MYFIKLFLLVFLLSFTFLYAKNETIEKVTLQLQWKHQFEFAGFYAAKEKGFYQDAGLDVEFTEYDESIIISNEVLQERAQYGLSYSSIIAEYLDGKPLLLVANFFKQSPLVLVAQKDIRTPKDLKGKKVMGVSDSIDNITLVMMLEKFGISLNEIDIVSTTFNPDDFIDKKVDAMSVFTTNELFYLEQKGVKYNLFDPTVYGAKYYDVNLFTSKNELKHHPLRVKKFKEASIRGWQYALTHQDEIIDLILQKYNTQNKSKEALRFEAKQIEQIMLPNVYAIGSINPDRIRNIADSFIQSGFVKNVQEKKLDAFIYREHQNPLHLSTKELDFIDRHPEIVLGIEKDWKPYVIVEKDGTINGYDADVLELINQVSGTHFVLKAGRWSEMQEKAKSKEIDGLSAGGIHDERKEYLNFSDIYISMQKMVITSKENPKNIQTLQDLYGKTIAIHNSNLVDEKTVLKFPTAKILRLDTIEEVIASVTTGKADAMFGNGATFYLANELGFPYLKQVARLDDTLSLAFGVRKDWPEAISIINKSLTLIGEHKLLELKNKWFFKDKETVMNVVSGTLELTNTQVYYLSKKKQITVCVDPDWMPFEKIEDGKLIGMSAEYMKIFQAKLGIPITLLPTNSWTQSVSNIKNRKCDILPLALASPSRKEYMNFTKPYLDLPLVIATTLDKFFISDMNELNGKRIGMVKGYAELELLKEKYRNVQFIEVDSVTDGLEQVLQEKLYGLIDNLSAIGYQIQKSFPQGLKIAGRMNEGLKLGVGIRNDEPELLEILNQAIDLIDDETKQSILNRWIFIKYEQGFNTKLFWQILTPFLLVALLLLLRQWFLGRYNKKLKKEVADKVDELRHKDEILLIKYRMAAMGEMLSMIAHQWRQPLGAISSALMGIEVKLSSGKFDLDDKNDRKDFLAYLEKKHHSINEYVQFLSTTTDDFRNFFNPNKQKDVISLTAPVTRALKIVQTSMQNKEIEIVMDFRANSEFALYQNEVMQVVLNILQNSEDNFLAKKTTAPKITITTYTAKNRSIISICDNGGGIRKEIMDTVFDPYFSTKDEKNGTGLGLYISKIIIEDHHDGKLDVKNTAEGVCFEIIFNNL